MITFTRECYTVQPLGLRSATVSGDAISLAFGGEGPGSPDEFHAEYARDPDGS